MKITISIVSGILILVQIFTNKIDWFVIALFTIGVIPWLSNLITSIELPGGVKIKYREFEKLEERAEKGGLLEPSAEKQDGFEYSFQKVGLDEPNLALAGLRIEIETKLKRLAKQNDIGTNMQGIGRLVRELSKKQIINRQQSSIIEDMIDLLNEAVHGAKIDVRSAQWAIEVGPKLLRYFDDISK